VAAAVAACVIDPATAGKTYEIGGPAVFTFKALMELICREVGRHPLLLPIPFDAAALIGVGGDLICALPIPIAPPLTTDQVTQLRSDNVVSVGALTLADLGIAPTALETIVPSYLYRFRRGGQYADQLSVPAKV